jgi:hypothetical protein
MKRTYLIAALLVFASAAHAQGLRESLQGEAKSQFDAATRAYRSRSWAEARTGYLRAYESSGDARILYNVAVVEKSQGRFAQAIGVLRKSLASGKGTLDPKFALTVSDSITALSRDTAEYAVDGLDTAMQLTVDDEPSVEGAPGTILLNPGPHTIIVRKAGYLTLTKNVDAVRGTKGSLEVSMTRIEAPLVVTIGDVEGGILYVDGKRAGTLPYAGTVSSGEHEIRVEAPGYRTESKSIVAGEKDNTLSFQLRSLTPKAMLNIVCDHPDCTIILDEKPVGSGTFRGNVAAGEHRVRLSAPGAESKLVELALREGERRDLRASPTVSRGINPWYVVAGGVVVAGVTAGTVYALTRPPVYEGQTPGTLDPRFVAASRSLR